MNLFEKKSVIAAVRSRYEFEKAVMSKAKCIFLLSGNILDFLWYINTAKAHGKYLFFHMDMMEGLGKDSSAVEYVSKLGVYGIISTRGNIVKTAKAMGLCTVQRFFMVDGQSVKTALDTLRQTKPTYAEIMPGTVYKVIKEFSSEGIPIIAGGLVNTVNETQQAFCEGAVAVSTSESSLWGYEE